MLQLMMMMMHNNTFTDDLRYDLSQVSFPAGNK